MEGKNGHTSLLVLFEERPMYGADMRLLFTKTGPDMKSASEMRVGAQWTC